MPMLPTLLVPASVTGTAAAAAAAETDVPATATTMKARARHIARVMIRRRVCDQTTVCVSVPVYVPATARLDGSVTVSVGFHVAELLPDPGFAVTASA